MPRETSCKMPLAFDVPLVVSIGVAAADATLDVVLARVVWFVVWDGVQVAAFVWRAAGSVVRYGGGKCGG